MGLAHTYRHRYLAQTPLVSFLLLWGLLVIPSDQSEQAILDAASLRTRMHSIVLPWLRPLALILLPPWFELLGHRLAGTCDSGRTVRRKVGSIATTHPSHP